MERSTHSHRGSLCKKPPSAPVSSQLGFAYVAVLVAIATFHAQPVRAEKAPSTVLVYNHANAPAATLLSAEREATRILDSAATIVWVNCWDETQRSVETNRLCAKGWTSQTPGLTLIPGTNRLLPKEFGEASIPVYATVYYEHIALRAHEDNSEAELPILLGCVIAHELGHLLGVSGHSTSGIMQPHFGANQIRQALMGNLLFTKEQTRLIQQRVLLAVNR
jgi:hypothetical protein